MFEKTLLVASPMDIWITKYIAECFPNILFYNRMVDSSELFITSLSEKIKAISPNTVIIASTNVGSENITKKIVKFVKSSFGDSIKLIFITHKTFSCQPDLLVKHIDKGAIKCLDAIVYYSMDVKKRCKQYGFYDKLYFIPLWVKQIGKINEEIGENIVTKTIPLDISEIDICDKGYAFSGGFARRDYNSLINAVNGLPVNLHLETSDRELRRTYKGDLPKNVSYNNRDRSCSAKSFFEQMAESSFVIVPIDRVAKGVPRGLTSLTQSIYMGKPIIINKSIAFDWYVKEGENALLVDYGDVNGYKKAISKMINNKDLFNKLKSGSERIAKKLSAESFTSSLEKLCKKVEND